jgi:hypothetical protein
MDENGSRSQLAYNISAVKHAELEHLLALKIERCHQEEMRGGLC